MNNDIYTRLVHVLPHAMLNGTARDDSGCTHAVVSDVLDTQNCNRIVALCFDPGTAEHIARVWNDNLSSHRIVHI